jgi:hypothetical protein
MTLKCLVPMGQTLGGLVLHFSLGSLFYAAGALMLVGVIAGALLTPLYKRQLAELHVSNDNGTARSAAPLPSAGTPADAPG